MRLTTTRSTRPEPADSACAGLGLRDEVRLAVARAAAVWRECGVLRGESVAIGLVDGGESVVACLGLAAAGGVPVAVDPLLPADELQRLWVRSGWRFILTESRAQQPAALRDCMLTRAEWRQALDAGRPLMAQSAASAT